MSDVNRRAFIAGGAAAGAAMSLPAASYARIKAANEKLKIAFLGTGGRCQQHIDTIIDLRDDGQAVDPYAVCDVWDGDETLGKRNNDKKNRTGRGLYPERQDLRHPDGRRQGPHLEGLPHDPRQQGRGRGVHRHARPLARPDGARRAGARQGRVHGEADDQDHRGGHPRGRRGRQVRPHGHGGRAVDGRPDVAGGVRVHQGR
jgi:hypothetical protein